MTTVARRTDPGTSWAAAQMAEPRAETNRALALRVLRDHPKGLTDFELADLTGLQQTSVGKRRGELRDSGLVRATDRHRRSPSGAMAIVWEAVPLDESDDSGRNPGFGPSASDSSSGTEPSPEPHPVRADASAGEGSSEPLEQLALVIPRNAYEEAA